ncbi:MAG: MFS transporter [Bacteroidia bacterium]|nr:MFS transporter [Bacteroidia bacterium]
MKQKGDGKGLFSPYQRMVLIILALTQFMVVLDFMVLAPIGDIVIKSLHINTQQFGMVVSAYIFSAAISGFLAAGFIDRFGRKQVLLFFFTGFIIGTLFCALSTSYHSLFIARIVTGIFGGVIGSLSMTIVTDLFAPNQRGRAMSVVQMAFATSQILGIPLGIYIANKFDWQHTFYLIVCASIFILLLVWTRFKPMKEHLHAKSDKHPLVQLWQTLVNKEHQAGFLAVVFIGMGMMLQPFVSIFLVNNVHLTNEQLPLLFLVTGIAALVVMPLVGRLSDKFNRYKIFLVGSAIAVIIVPIYTNLPVVSIGLVFVVNILMFAAITSRMAPFQALNTMIPRAEHRGAYMSISSSLQQVSAGIGIVVASSIVTQASPTSPLKNFNILGYLVVALVILACLLVYRVSKIALSRPQHLNTVEVE